MNASARRGALGVGTLLAVTALVACAARPAAAQTPRPASGQSGKRIVYVDSYHPEYETSILKQNALRGILDREGINVTVVYLDEKRRGDENSLRAAGAAAAEKIREVSPDVIVAADDAASKYVIVPYFKDAHTPVVFFDVNWTVEPYGYPFTNATGQTEVELVGELLGILRQFAHGSRAAMLSADTMTDRKTVEYCEKVLGVHFASVRLVSTFQAFKDAFLALQREADMIVFRNNAGISGWDDAEAERFVRESITVPTGGVTPLTSRWTVVNLAKVNEEGAEWAAQTVLRILGGASPSSIPLTTNRRGKMILNMGLAKRLGIIFPMEMIQQADFVEEGQR